MLPAPPAPLPPALTHLVTLAYNRGRQDFVKTTVAALKEPAFKDVRFTATQWAEMIQSASDKCDATPPAKSLTN